MPNIFNPFGLQSLTMTGTIGSFDFTNKRISPANTQQIFKGDPVVQLTTGYIRQYQPGEAHQIAGIFMGCYYPSIAAGGRTVWSRFWPGADAQPNSVVQAQVISSANFLYDAQSGPANQTTPLGITGFDLNYDVGYFTPLANAGSGGNGNILTGFSTAFIDATTASASTTTLPFRVVDFSPGVFGNGTDQTAPFNLVKVALNFADTRVLTGTSVSV